MHIKIVQTVNEKTEFRLRLLFILHGGSLLICVICSVHPAAIF